MNTATHQQGSDWAIVEAEIPGKKTIVEFHEDGEYITTHYHMNGTRIAVKDYDSIDEAMRDTSSIDRCRMLDAAQEHYEGLVLSS